MKIFKYLSLVLVAFCLTVNAAEYGADRHIKKGLTCETCHGPDKNNPKYPETEDCLKCHDKNQLIAKTKTLEPNPHNAPHNGDCVLCHAQHEEAQNYCAQCHKFDYHVK